MTTRAVLYARVSTDRQASTDRTSLESQLAACRALAEREGWEVVAELTDQRSGGTLDRPGLDDVRRLARGGHFDLLVANSQDRISRRQTDTGILYTELTKANIQIWTVQEGTFDTTPTGQFMRQAYAFSAELDRERRREATQRGIRAKARAGRLIGSSPQPKYGYAWMTETRPDGTEVKVAYQPHEPEASVVRWLYTQTVAGVSTRELARHLNARGVPTRYGTDDRYRTKGEWTSQSVRVLLRSECYKGGGLALSLKRGPVAQGKRYSSVVRDLTSAVELSDTVIPALVEPDLWRAAQAIIDSRTLLPVNSRESADVWVRGGITVCGVCGGRMVLAHKPNGRRYLKCGRAGRERTACGKPSPTIITDRLQDAVWDKLRDVLRRPEILWDRHQSEAQVERDEEAVAMLTGQLAELEQRRARLLRSLEMLEHEDDLADVRSRLAEIAAERDDLSGELATMERRVESRRRGQDRATRLSSWLVEELGSIDNMTPEQRREAALTYGMVVEVYPTGSKERFEIKFGVFPEEETFFDAIDFDAIGEPTAEQRAETYRLEREAAERGYGAEEIERLLNGSHAARYGLM